MKRISLLFLAGIVLSIGGEVYGQDYVESAMMFSRTNPGGSARIQALGGAQTSLGGDYSSAFANPAGLGFFNRSEFTISPGMTVINNDSKFFGTSSSESISKLQIPGLSAVFNVPSGREGGSFIGGSFAISLNRIADFNSSMVYSGANTESSIIQSFILNANGETTSQFDADPVGYNYNTPTGLAYYTYLIGPASTLDPNFPDDEYFTDVQSNFEEYLSDADQTEEILRKGAINQWSLSYGANFLDKFYVGGGIGIASLKYESNAVFSESYSIDPVFEGMMLDETLKVKGSGINATLGAIAKPVDFLQVGISYTTPTFYQLTETYEALMQTQWKNFDYYGDGSVMLNDETASTDVVTSEYNLTVPGRLSAGVTLISKIGFITGDIEYTNGSNAKYSSDISGISYSGENDAIKRAFNSSINYRIGAEYRYNIFRVRAGYAILANNLVDSSIDNKVSSYSGGLGVRFDKLYIDFALVYRQTDGLYSPYQISDSAPVVEFTRKITSGLITLGFTF